MIFRLIVAAAHIDEAFTNVAAGAARLGGAAAG